MAQDASVLARPHLLLVSDPMCSWCYAFSGVARQLEDHYRDRLALRVVAPGMRDDPRPIPADRQAGLLEMLGKVRDASGRAFAGLERLAEKPLAFDSTPSCRLVLAAREMHGDTFALDVMDALQRAFYEQGVAIGDRDRCEQVVADWLQDRPEEAQQLFQASRSAATEAALRTDMDFARQLRIEGFPTLLGWDGARYYRLFAGHQPLDVAKLVVDRFIERALTVAPDAQVH